MALTISQIMAASYAAVVAEMRKPANQWGDSTFLDRLDAKGGVERKDLGPTIEAPLDYRANPNGAFISDMQVIGTAKTDVITAASYTPAELSEPVVWSKRDDALNPSTNQKIDLVKSLLENGINSHDDLLEQALFATTTNGFLGFGTHITTAGTGSDGGIDSSIETWWQNQQATYVDDTDIEAAMTTVWNACAKGSGSSMLPNIIVSGSAANAVFEGSQVALQRYADQNIRAGAKSLMFKTANYDFSKYGGTNIYMLNTKNYKLVVSKQYFRDKEDTQPFVNAHAFMVKIYSALQTVVTNRSRLGVAHL